MFRIFDRYLIREMVMPLLLGLLVLTFVAEIPTILNQGAALLAKGVEWSTVVRVLVLLLPSSLSITIPMSVLLAILVAFGRLSADREFVAMQACGVSVFRLLRPVGLIALLGLAATAYEIIVALPNSNQTFREITFGLVASQVESDVKPRVFFQTFPDRLLYVRDVGPGGGWRDVFLADLSQPGYTTAYVAREGRIIVDRTAKTVRLQLKNGTSHKTQPGKPDEYEGAEFESIVLTLDPLTVFPPPPSKGAPEMTIAELRKTIATAQKAGAPTYSERFMIQYKFSFPVSCLVLAVIGIGLGVSNRKDGKLASFALGFGVIFAYYVLLYFARAAAMGGKLNPDWAPWIPHLLLGAGGFALLLWRAGSADQPIRIGLPAFWRSADAPASDGPRATGPSGLASQSGRVLLVLRIPHLRLPRPNLLDLYIGRQYGRVFFIALFSLLGVFYISTFIDLADKLFRGQATTSLLLRYFFYQTPQFIYYVIPMAGLVATLVTIGVMTKTSELVVMRACGISLYRTSVPLIVLGLLGSLALFALEERVLATSNREADRLNSIIRGYPVQTFDALNRRWVAGTAGEIYYYDSFTPSANRFSHFTLYDFDDRAWRLDAVTYADAVALGPHQAANAHDGVVWTAINGWRRTFATTREKNRTKTWVTYTPFTNRDLPLEPPGYFKTEVPDALTMTYGQLAVYVTQLKASGFNAVPQMVQLQKKAAFPFVTLIMTLLAVPFAVTTGRRGALYGVGVGIVLAIVYWITMSVLGALGEGGVITPVLAAWAPNILFGAAALYMILTVRT